MYVKGIIEEDFVNYKVPSMFINTCICDFKCCTEAGISTNICQNSELMRMEKRWVADDVIYQHFKNNPITKAVVVGGMEPFLQSAELIDLINVFRRNGEDAPFVIYTGYYPHEVREVLNELRYKGNIIVKFGRFVPNSQSRYDELLGITLASDNQYAERIS